MELTSLATVAASAPLEADVCIVGAGAAGLFLARCLVRDGVRVVVLEAGPEKPVDAAAAGIGCEFSASAYRGATEGRAFGVGGTSARWGGQLVSYASTDVVRADPAIATVWRHILDVDARYRAEVARDLGVHAAMTGDGPFVPDALTRALAAANLDTVVSCWLPFRRRNFAWMIGDKSTNRGAARVVCDAVVGDWRLIATAGGRARIGEVVARSRSGERLRVRAGRFVVAAGAIESTRILLEVQAAGSERVIPAQAALGQGLSDHLSFTAGAITTAARASAAHWFGPRFTAGCMATRRLVDAAPDAAAPRYFAHVLFEMENPGFALARSVLQAAQQRRLPALPVRDWLRGVNGATKLAWSRWIRSELYIPPRSPCHLQIDMEQRPRRSNTIQLASTRDAYGRATVRLGWDVDDGDRADIESVRACVRARWQSGAPELALAGDDTDDFDGAKVHDAYHPVGSCRLGGDGEAVVREDLRVRGTDNLYLLSTAVFPSAGSANPTFTLLCFARMLAARLQNATAP